MFQKTTTPNYLINRETNLVINTNESELLSYKAQVKQVVELRELKKQYHKVNDELTEIKSLLKSLLQKDST